MTWDEFQVEKELYKSAWAGMRRGYTGAIRDFLEQSRLIVACGREFDIDADLTEVAQACPAFFLDDERVNITDSWRVEIKFPYVDIDMIQEIKESPYCDRDNTLMRPSSTNVIILKEPVITRSSSLL